MDHHHIDPHANFTDAECALIIAVFKRMQERGCVPVVLYALNSSGMPCAIFNNAFNQDEADLVGTRIGESLMEIAPTPDS